jgi:putative nucleotidyltransferase with HDIG domain
VRTQANSPGSQLTLVLGATLLVAVLPVALVWRLRVSGAIGSPLAGVFLGMALSLGISTGARALWEKHKGSEDLLFSELLLWGFVNRWVTQRRLSSALDMLGPIAAGGSGTLQGVSRRGRAKLHERLVWTQEMRDPYTHGHSRRVARHAWMIARRMGLSRAEVARIRTAAAIHDVGKVETPKEILHKPARLTDEEYEVIKRHPVDGARMCEVLGDPELTAIVLHHHERLDGTGYPNRLAGTAIPIGARIIAVADTFDAITSVRPYRELRTHREAIEILKHEAGTQLDPDVVRAFCRHYAGRRTLAAWSVVGSVPERIASWLGSGMATAASVAKVVVVATLVGGAAVTASTVGVAHAHHHAGKPAANVSPRSAPVGGSSSSISAPRPARIPDVAPARAGNRNHAGARREVVRFAPIAGGGDIASASTGAQAAAGRIVEGGAGKTSGSERVAARREEGEEASSGKAQGKEAEKPAERGKSEEAAAKGKSEEAPGKAKSEEASSAGEEVSAGNGKSEEASAGKGKGKSQQSSGKGKEEVAAGADE